MSHPIILLLTLIVSIESASIPMEMIEMTHIFDETTLHPPGHQPFQLIVKHNGTKDGKFWLQLENIYTGLHVGTHMDAPCHLIKGGACLDKVPIEHMIAPAAVIDVEEKCQHDPDYLVQPVDLQKWEAETNDTLDGVIVMIRSGWGKRWPNKKAFIGTEKEDETKMHYPGMSEEACRWLVENRKPIALATETLSLDYGPSTDNIAHQILLGNNMFGLECVANMDKIPITGATIIVSPMLIGNASGAPVRIYAIFPKYLKPGVSNKDT